ncbi:MAG: beta-ketoacyl synthase N-terminal-like domain-containing protein [Tessaracoccus sp.]
MTEINESSTPPATPDVLKRALAAIDQLQRELEASRRRTMEPIAVIGMACRFPGGLTNPEEFWELLAEGRDAIEEVPLERWDAAGYYDPRSGTPGKMNTRWGGFVHDLDQFDPGFFGISPREAEVMDPNQRLVMEVSWEALENAGCRRLAGTRTGVYIGSIGSEFALGQFSRNADNVSPYATTGSAMSVVSGRLSFLLDLQGPALTVDTACSSSLAAVHLACQGLRSGETDMAIAGGVNILLSPMSTIAASQFGMTSPTGRCRAFDTDADGFVRSEGCGVVVLKRLSDAQKAGDTILAVLRGSAMNQDGRSTGLTAPNVESQKRVIRQALAGSGVKPTEVSFVEAHGTGTPLGDPIEAEALAEVYTADDEDTWFLGSVKSNLGHTEGAAGVASLMKVILALQHRVIPPNIHFRELSPNIDIPDRPFEVPTEAVAWHPRADRRIAAVSGFGLSGTNVHLLVEEAPAVTLSEDGESRPGSVLALSSRTTSGLRALVTTHEEWLSRYQPPAADYCGAINTGRMTLPCRIAVAGRTSEALADSLRVLVDDPLFQAQPVSQPPQVAFLFGDAPDTVIDPQLYRLVPAFRAAVDELRSEMNESPQLLLDAASPGRRHKAVFIAQYALAGMWRAWGVVPSFATGLGTGAITAACMAGALSLHDALAIVDAYDQMDADPACGAVEALQVVAAAPRLPLVSASTGELYAWERPLPPAYWQYSTLRRRRIDAALRSLAGLGAGLILDISAARADGLRDIQDTPARVRQAVTRDISLVGWEALCATVAELFSAGVEIDWCAFEEEAGAPLFARPPLLSRGRGSGRIPLWGSPGVFR